MVSHAGIWAYSLSLINFPCFAMAIASSHFWRHGLVDLGGKRACAPHWQYVHRLLVLLEGTFDPSPCILYFPS